MHHGEADGGGLVGLQEFALNFFLLDKLLLLEANLAQHVQRFYVFGGGKNLVKPRLEHFAFAERPVGVLLVTEYDVLKHRLGHAERVYDLGVRVYAFACDGARQLVVLVVTAYDGLGRAELELLGLLRAAQVLLHLNAQTARVAEV